LGFECGQYLWSGVYLDHIEDNSVIAAWQYLHGVPLYGFSGRGPHAATYYGPVFYLSEAAALWLFGAGVTIGKLLSLAAAVAILAVLGAHFLRRAPVEDAVYPIAYLAGGLLLFSPVSFWVRPDPFEALFVALAVVGAANPWMVGLCIGLAVNCKVHAFLYFTPILVDLYCRGGWRAGLRMAATAGAAFLLPFALPGVSLHDYVVMLAQQIGGRPPSARELWPILVYLTVMCAPIVVPLSTQDRPWQDRLYAGACLAAVILLLYPATFPGAGAYHFFPLLPALAEARHRLRPQGLGSEFDLFPMLLAAGVGMTQTTGEIGKDRAAAPLVAEATALAEASPGRTVEIGYGDNGDSYMASQLGRTLLTFAGFPARYDAQILMELRQIGIDESRRWAGELAGCKVGRWLLPRGERPFAVLSYFYDKKPVFDDAFRHAFRQHYRRVATTAHFDVWDCTGKPLGGR
jgi:hypothetical protein